MKHRLVYATLSLPCQPPSISMDCDTNEPQLKSESYPPSYKDKVIGTSSSSPADDLYPLDDDNVHVEK
ncbi:hypothetical protein V6N13_088926 [Hibiscus sabdariffa]|uniref:Uncharacterized protein n=1 Tax=Hibiscus sabdariffa TaxID=183260 RepID=A0ABR2G1M7_9ROSI